MGGLRLRNGGSGLGGMLSEGLGCGLSMENTIGCWSVIIIIF